MTASTPQLPPAPLTPPVEPMLARAARAIPEPSSSLGGLLYEPKWDGYRCILFRHGDAVTLGSRGGKPLTRYFPELVAAARAQLPPSVVLDGEIVVAVGGSLDFDALAERIHPAESRVTMLAEKQPAQFVAFDLLALGEQNLLAEPFRERRSRLLELAGALRAPLNLTPATTDPAVAADWFNRFEGAGIDGIIAKPLDAHYQPGVRALVKVKHERTADCVVAGFRWHKSGDVVGSLLLGLYDAGGALHQVGVSSAFPMGVRRELVDLLAPYQSEPGEEHPWLGEQVDEARRPGAPSRWRSGKDTSWQPLRPELVCEVAYDQMQGTRFRHTAQFRRWRPDRAPDSCTFAQLQRPESSSLASVLTADGAG